MQVEDFDACCCEGLDWRKGKNDQNQGMTILDILILTKSFPANKKKNGSTLSPCHYFAPLLYKNLLQKLCLYTSSKYMAYIIAQLPITFLSLLCLPK